MHRGPSSPGQVRVLLGVVVLALSVLPLFCEEAGPQDYISLHTRRPPPQRRAAAAILFRQTGP